MLTCLKLQLQTFAYYTLLLALSEVTFCLQMLSFTWALVLTIEFFFFANDVPNILRSVKSAAIYLHLKFKCNQTDFDSITFKDMPL